MTGRLCSPGTPVSSTNKIDRHDMTEILLKVALNTETPQPYISKEDIFCCQTGSRNLEGPFYESHYLSESEKTGAKFKHLRFRMSVEMILSTKYYK